MAGPLGGGMRTRRHATPNQSFSGLCIARRRSSAKDGRSQRRVPAAVVAPPSCRHGPGGASPLPDRRHGPVAGPADGVRGWWVLSIGSMARLHHSCLNPPSGMSPPNGSARVSPPVGPGMSRLWLRWNGSMAGWRCWGSQPPCSASGSPASARPGNSWPCCAGISVRAEAPRPDGLGAAQADRRGNAAQLPVSAGRPSAARSISRSAAPVARPGPLPLR
jgi:hypothetical protein